MSRFGGVLQIEPTDACNLRCRMCSPHSECRPHSHGAVSRGFMDPGLFYRIVDELQSSDMKFDHVILQWMGEPFLHPRLEHFIDYALPRLASRVGYLRIDTNALALTPPRIERLLASFQQNSQLPLLLVFSLDAVRPDTYRRVKGARPGDFEKVQQHIDYLLDARGRLKVETLNLNCEFQFVLQPGNAHEVQSFVVYWEERLRRLAGIRGHDEVMIKRLSVGTGGREQAASDALYEEAIRGFGLRPYCEPNLALKLWERSPWKAPQGGDSSRGPCPALWRTPVIRWDGELSVCCTDLHGQIHVGNLREFSLETLFFGSRMNAYRIHHLEGAFERMSLCRECGGIGFHSLEMEEIRAFLEQVERPDLLLRWEKLFGKPEAS